MVVAVAAPRPQPAASEEYGGGIFLEPVVSDFGENDAKMCLKTHRAGNIYREPPGALSYSGALLHSWESIDDGLMAAFAW